MEIIRLETFNPYEALYPGKRVVSHDTLLMIKALRANDHVVEIEGVGPLRYVFRKGLREFLQDPVIALAVGVPIGIACNLISSAIYDALKDWTAKFGKPSTSEPRVLVRDESGFFRRPNGDLITQVEANEVLRPAKKEATAFARSRSVIPPFAGLSGPIFREHIPSIVGWCRIDISTGVLIARECRITDEQTRQMLLDGTLQGMSVGGIAEESTCSVCNQDYVACNHVSGREYPEGRCINKITRSLLADISLVRDPINPDCVSVARAAALANV